MLSSIMYKQEIATFLLSMVLLQVTQLTWGKRWRVIRTFWPQQLLILLLAVYFTGVCHYTLLHRDITASMTYELSLFWSYRYVLAYNSESFFAEVLYNVLLLFPMGILIPLYQQWFRKFRYTLLAGFGTSCLIEICQLIFHIGLFELDDMFNNTLGCCIGYSVFYLAACIARRTQERRWAVKLTVLLLLDVFVIGYFVRLWMNIH